MTTIGAGGVETWAPGREIVLQTTVGAGISIVNADGKELRTVRRASGYDIASIGGWSPDGQLLLYAVDGVATWRLSDGSIRRLTRNAGDNFPAWGPGAREIAFARDGLPSTRGIWIVNRDGSKVRRITTAPNPYGFGGPNEYRAPSWAPR